MSLSSVRVSFEEEAMTTADELEDFLARRQKPAAFVPERIPVGRWLLSENEQGRGFQLRSFNLTAPTYQNRFDCLVRVDFIGISYTVSFSALGRGNDESGIGTKGRGTDAR